MFEAIQSNLMEIVVTIVTAVAGWLGVQIKNAYTKYVDTKLKKEIVKSTVEYVEQIAKGVTMSSQTKFDKAKKKALEWLTEKGLKVSDTELEVLIESAVKALNEGMKGA